MRTLIVTVPPVSKPADTPAATSKALSVAQAKAKVPAVILEAHQEGRAWPEAQLRAKRRRGGDRGVRDLLE